MLERDIEIIRTADGSSTLRRLGEAETFHSMRGALSEARYVFAGCGLRALAEARGEISNVRILEYGLGSGLNLLATLERASSLGLTLDYHGVEGFPLPPETYGRMAIPGVDPTLLETWREAMTAPWGVPRILSSRWHLRKTQSPFESFAPSPEAYDLAYFDAFSPGSEPELWSESIFGQIASSLARPGVLVTYSASGLAKRALRACGLVVERHPGFGGKLHMLVAIRR